MLPLLGIMGTKAEVKKTKADIKANALAEAERVAAIAEQERIEKERLLFEKYAADQAIRRELIEECQTELERQHDAEEGEQYSRDTQRQRLYEKQAEIDEWQV